MSTPAPLPPPTEAKTHCPYCAFQCGMLLGLAASPQRTVRADPDFPVNRGQMCIKGFTSAELLVSRARVTNPALRLRGGRWNSVSWEEALGFVADKMSALRDQYGPDSLGAFGSGALTNEKAYLLGKLVRVGFGSSQIDYNGRYCMASAAAGQNRAFGIDRGLPFPISDIADTRTLLLWGSNCADTMPPIMQWVQKHRARGGSLIVVDPRRTETARNARIHLQPTPGSDLALGNALLALAIDMQLVDWDFIQERTVGFDNLRRSLAPYEPAQVERMTGVPLGQMREVVRLLAAESSMLLSGRGPEQQSKGTDTVTTFTNLMLALGKVGKPASGYGCLTGQGNGQGGREHGQKADQLPGYRSIEDPAAREHMARIWGIAETSLPRKGKSAYEMLDAIGSDDGIRSLLVLGSNLVVASPHAQRVAQRLGQLELLVICDSFWNETAELGDVFLPTKQWAEETGTMTNLEGRVILRREAVTAPPSVRSDIEILCELGRRLGPAGAFDEEDSEALFDELCRATAGSRADYSGLSYDRLEAEQGVFWPCPEAGHAGTPRLFQERFVFPDGKARFTAVAHVPAGEEPDADYPLYFTTGRYKEHYNSGAQTRLVGPLMQARPEPRVQMHARLAQTLGVRQDDYLLVESRRGEVEFRVTVDHAIRPDTLFAPFHWGGRQAANLLTNPALDPTSRMPEFKICAVRARAVTSRREPATP